MIRKLRISASSLNGFFESKCPAAWKYNRDLEKIGPVEDHFQRGLTIHALMEGTVDRKDIADTRLLSLYDKLLAVRHNYSIQSKSKELWQEFDILPGILWQRKIDDLAVVRHTDLMVIDWKSAMGGWKTFQSGRDYIAPQSRGFQSIGYVIPPPDNPDWPRKMMYVVAGFRGPAQIFLYEYRKADYENLLAAARLLQVIVGACEKDKYYPKVRGYACHECRFKSPCFNEPGWESQFKKRTRNKE